MKFSFTTINIIGELIQLFNNWKSDLKLFHFTFKWGTSKWFDRILTDFWQLMVNDRCRRIFMREWINLFWNLTFGNQKVAKTLDFWKLASHLNWVWVGNFFQKCIQSSTKSKKKLFVISLLNTICAYSRNDVNNSKFWHFLLEPFLSF